MDFFLLIVVVLLMFVGLAGALIPGLPGPPISFAALLVLHFTSWIAYHENFLLLMALIAALITLLDYYVPIYGTKRFGGTRAGVIGSVIGLVAALFVLPVMGVVIGPFGLLGIILGPFLGALVGESIAGTSSDKAVKAAFGSFIGFLAGTLAKMAYSLVVIFYIVKDLVSFIFYRGDVL